MKILINALSGNGDALMFSPALKILKHKLPDAEVDMLVMFRSVEEMFAHSPELNNIHLIEFLKQGKAASIKQVLKLRKNSYDYSINIYPSNRIEYNLVNYFLGAKKKISHRYIHSNISRGEFLNNVLVPEIRDRHNVLQNLDLVKRIIDTGDEEAGPMEISIGDEDRANAKIWIKENNLEHELLIGFHPGSSTLKNHIHKRWVFMKYVELGKKLIKDYNARILLFGNEFDLNEGINRLMNGEAIIASTENFMDSIARMEHCRLFVSNDTAFMHCAAALQIPTVAIFAYTNYKELYPWMTRSEIIRRDIACSPCFYNSPKPAQCLWMGDDEFKCITRIEVDEVYEACRRLLN
jgi:heptosyltransferase-2